jgi:hypothetical protein
MLCYIVAVTAVVAPAQSCMLALMRQGTWLQPAIPAKGMHVGTLAALLLDCRLTTGHSCCPCASSPVVCRQHLST